MQAQGVKKGDVVFTWLPETGEQYETRLATFENGTIFASFHKHLPADAALTTMGRVKPTVLGSYIEPVTDVLGTLMVPFEAHPPEIGIVQPDFVPPGSVRNGNSNVPVSAQNGNKC